MATPSTVSNSTFFSFFEEAPPEALTLSAGVFALIFIVLGVTGNLLTILALRKHRKLKDDITSWFILSLSLSDLLFCVIYLPVIALRYFQGTWVGGEKYCPTWIFLSNSVISTSLMSMAAITVNRYVRIVHYDRYSEIFTKLTTKLILAFIWLTCLGLTALPLLKIWGEYGWDPEREWCTIYETNGSSPKIFMYVSFFLIPCLLIALCYVAIFFFVRRSKKNLLIRRLNEPRPSIDVVQFWRRSEETQLTKMILLVFCCYLVCYLPFMVVNITDFGDIYSIPYMIASIPVWSSACTNVIIYVLCNRLYRKAYKELLFKAQPSKMFLHSQSSFKHKLPFIVESN